MAGVALVVGLLVLVGAVITAVVVHVTRTDDEPAMWTEDLL